MIEAQMSIIAEKFGISLPRYYLEFLRSYPLVLDVTPTDLWGDSVLSDEMVPKNFDQIIELNGRTREEGAVWLEDDGGELPWPANYWAIGDAAGDYFVIDTNSPDQTVYLTNHENLTFEPWAKNLGEFVERLVAETSEDVSEMRNEIMGNRDKV